ncbi:MAG: helix-hairpin-helix domain-containing protein [Anaerolineales bacterium]
MSDIERLSLLTQQMHLEPDGDHFQEPLLPRARQAITVKEALLPNGRSIRLLKTLLSSYCERDCAYCPFRAQRDLPRAAFSPDEFAKLFDSLYRAGFVEGIFLSSSIYKGSLYTQDRLLDTAQILRSHYGFDGYLHLKIMPGAERAQVQEAMRLADRLSVNLEAPHPQALSLLAPHKDFYRELLKPLQWIHEIRQGESLSQAWKGKWPSSTTQFVVGAAGESDLDILSTTAYLQDTYRLSRAYYSSFTPYVDTPLENFKPSPPRREFRLYQAFFLVRDYGYDLEELPYLPNGNLPLDKDPKLSWAEHNLLQQPLEVNTASREQLLRVSGIGPTRATRILELRRQGSLSSFSQLRKARLVSEISAPYLLVKGRSPARQYSLF